MNALRARLGLRYWSLAQFLKHKVKNAVSYIVAFEEALAAEARGADFDGIVCGHIHQAEIRDIGGILYCNDGDWVESLTALVETADGELPSCTGTTCSPSMPPPTKRTRLHAHPDRNRRLVATG